MNELKYTALAALIVAYLKSRNTYDTVDTTLIDELVYNVELCDMAKADIRTNGIKEDISKGDNAYMQVNQSFAVYKSAVSTVTAISTKLGLTVLDRVKLKLRENETKSALNKLLEG